MQLGHSIVGDERAPLVVFLHGFLGARSDWLGTIEDCGGAFRSLAVDLPGHGESVGLDDGEYAIPAAATAVVDLIDTFDTASFSLVGYSMGGRLALYLASIYAMRIDALVIESASPGLMTAAERAGRRASDERWARMLEEQGTASFLDAWYRQPLFASLVARRDVLAGVKTKREQNAPTELARALRGMGVGRQPSLWEEWRGNHIPTLVIAGELDEKYRALAREMGEMCGAARVAVIPNAGHNVHEEAPDEYNRAILEFLNGVLK